MAKNYLQGKYVPRNPNKYKGDVNNIQIRSSWERKLIIELDTNPSVLEFSSEELVIPYVSPVDGRVHRYFPDFVIKVRTREGKIEQQIIEVKPYKQTLPPKGKRATKYLIEEYKTYAINQAKWAAAEEFCKKHNMRFVIMTEKELRV